MLEEKTVYVLQDVPSGYYKVGHAADLSKRLKTLNTSRAHRLECCFSVDTPYASRVERYAHHHLEAHPEVHRIRDGAGTEFFEASLDLVRDIVLEGRRFVEDLTLLEEQVEPFAEYDELQPQKKADDEEVLALAQELLDVRAKISSLQWRQERLENQLKIAIGRNEGIEGVATWKSQVRQTLDGKALKEEMPDIWEKFRRASRSRVLRLA